MEEEEKGISIGDIFRVIFSQKWLALILVFAITIVGTLAIYYGYGKRKCEYQMSFTLDLPGDNSLSSRYVYPDGSTFDCYEYASYEVLNSVKSSDESFKDVDVGAMVEGGGISVEMKYDTVGSDKAGLTTRTITLKTNAKYFDNATVARGFLSKLSSYPVDRFANIETNYESLTKELFASLSTFESQIDYIRNQVKNIDTLYDTLAEDTGSNVTDNNGNTITGYKEQLSAWLDIQKLDFLLVEAEANYYVKDYETEIVNLRNQLEVKEKDYSYVKQELDELKALLKADPDFAAPQLAELQSQLTGLQKDKDELNNFINRYYDGETLKQDQKQKTEAYAARIISIYDELIGDNGLINKYSTVSKQVYTKFASVTHAYPNVAVLTGGTGIMMSFIISLVAGIIIACIAAYIVGRYKSKKVAAATNEVYGGEMQLAAAAADESGEQLEIEDMPENEDKENKE